MKPGVISASIFAAACLAAAFLSGNILGVGMWAWLMLGAGIFVGLSVHFPVLAATGRAVGLLAGVLGFIAVALGLLAATIGGGFKLPADQASLLALIFVIAASGIALSRARPAAREER